MAEKAVEGRSLPVKDTNFTSRIIWDKPLSFILAAIGSAARLGNLWRFPYLAAA